MASSVVEVAPKRRWWQWFDPADSKEERKLILKLDLLIVPYAVLVYWLKYLDQANVNNAYVSGMKEELGFYGNELVHLQTIYIAGAVIFQIPFAYLFTKVKMQWLVPGLDVLWGVFTLLQYRANNYAEMMAYRFFVGCFEGAFFPAVHYVLGSWYRGDEISRRGGVFYLGLELGTLTSSLIQSAASAHLDGVHGLSGWRWMYIICAAVTLPLGFLGFLVWPGTPERASTRFLSETELQLARDRLTRAGHAEPKKYDLQTFKKVVTGWKVYVLTLWDCFFWNASITSTGAYLLWLKSLGRWDASELNNISASAPALGCLWVILICFAADLFENPPLAITIAYVVNAVGILLLTIWDVPEYAKWFGYNVSYFGVAMSSVLYGWANNILRHDAEERSIILTIMNSVAQSTNAWTPLLVFKTVEGPRFVKGYAFCFACTLMTIFMSWVVYVLFRHQERDFQAAKLRDSDLPSRESDLAAQVQVNGKGVEPQATKGVSID